MAKPAAKPKPTVKQKRKKKPLPFIDPDRAAATLCKREFRYFVQEFWDTIINEPMVWEPHMDILCNEIQVAFSRLFMRYDAEGNRIGRQHKEYDLIINIPPGTSKSTIISVMAPVWGWVNDPTLRFITAAYSGRVSISQAVLSRNIIRSPKFRLYYPHVQIMSDEDGKSDYKTTQNGQRFATSVGGSATSQHAHCLIYDDLLNPKQAQSQVQITSANDWMDTTASTRKVDKMVTITILVMQRLATNDPTGHLLEKRSNSRLRHICLPAKLSKNVKPKELKIIYQNGYLSPGRMPQPALDEARRDLGSNGYAGQFDQVPIPLGGGIWKKWFIEVPDEIFPSRHLMQKYGTDWDLAYTEKEENSACAYVTGGKIDHRIYIDDLGWDWLEFPGLITWMKTRPSPHFIEAKASGKSSKQTLTSQGVIAIEVPVIGGDKVARANMATPVAESGIVHIRKSLVDRLYNDTKQGILLFPKAEHTDLADALAQFLQRLDGRSEIKVANEHREDDELLDEDIPF